MAVAVGQHLFADFAESGHILREGVLNTATIVGAEANGVVALHINNFRVVSIQLRSTVFKRQLVKVKPSMGYARNLSVILKT